MSVLNILAFFTAAGAAWQDLHFRKVSNRYLAICLGLAILLYICLEIDTVVFKRNLILQSIEDQVVDMMLEMSPNQVVNMISDMTLDNVADMVVDMAIYIGSGMAVPVLLLWWAFLLRKIGAGDIKLLSALGAMMGLERILNCMLWTCLIALALEGMKRVSSGFVFFTGKARTNSRNHALEISEGYLEKLRLDDGKTKARVQKREGIPLAFPVFLATVAGICGLY